eukprot:CAMPEP_0114577980 /NCGR_PEP_ID=MMETSP0125-20121206/2583_1 /TAXON_ID=485358 ORGANISM="Aristerostoma sp., Strain ATCC 50986" /NCGR_SAMPLE_ID=MMETSP0125 /ASSEMBLY_ACC=CAM_ASM_000245 /LENGTH=213 /DNA_ID=CAMNT_0001767719 /DNA_START=1 /DNA_END=642 /DNA_ORIENTATION=+
MAKSGMDYTDEMVEYSIFPKDEAKANKMKDLVLQDKFEEKDILLSKALGSLYSMVVADSFGHTVEFMPCTYTQQTFKDLTKEEFHDLKKVQNVFMLKPGQWTDDSAMGLCLADSLIEVNKLDCLDLRKRFIAWWCYGYNNAFRFDKKRSDKRSVGLGGNISVSFNEFIKTKGKSGHTMALDKNSSGNGSIMRLAPLPIFFHDKIDEGMESAAS